jgi:Rad3-related DNA helicase
LWKNIKGKASLAAGECPGLSRGAERGYLVQRFREEVSSVLVGVGFWEGIDVPGEALSLLVIWRLPFPPRDPLIEARCREAEEQGPGERIPRRQPGLLNDNE